MEAMEQDLAAGGRGFLLPLARGADQASATSTSFDRVFGHVFKGLELIARRLPRTFRPEWLKSSAEKISHRGGEEGDRGHGRSRQAARNFAPAHAGAEGPPSGGQKWIGNRRHLAFGAYGYNPEGVRIGQDGNRNFRAVKVWDKREFKDLDDQVELGTRNIKIALRRLRKFARTGAPEELDLDGTIKGTAHRAISTF